MEDPKIDASYYEKNDFSTQLKDSGKVKYSKAKTKRITMNISELAYDDAHELDKYMNMGYQNVLKAAIILGLNDLYEQVNANRKIST